MELIFRLPEIRARHGRMTLKELSEKTGIAASTLSRIDSGKSHRLDYETLLTLCKFFRLSPGEFFEIKFDEGEERFNDLVLMAAS